MIFVINFDENGDIFLIFCLFYIRIGIAESVRVVIESLDTHPVCEHGPALLFERYIDHKIQQFYACSAYRDQTECPLLVRVDKNETTMYDRHLLTQNKENSVKLAQNQLILLQKVIKKKTALFSMFEIFVSSCLKFVFHFRF